MRPLWKVCLPKDKYEFKVPTINDGRLMNAHCAERLQNRKALYIR